MHADTITKALNYAISETNRRRAIQTAYNTEHGITPTTILKEIRSIADQLRTQHDEAIDVLMKVDVDLYKKNPLKTIKDKRRQMEEAVAILDFETAAIIRDEIMALENITAKEAKKKKIGGQPGHKSFFNGTRD